MSSCFSVEVHFLVYIYFEIMEIPLFVGFKFPAIFSRNLGSSFSMPEVPWNRAWISVPCQRNAKPLEFLISLL